MVFFMLTNCFSLPKTFYFLRTSTCFNHPALLEKYDKTVRDGLSKVCNVNFDEFSGTQLDLHSKIGSLGVSSPSLLALPPFWPQLLVRVTSSRRVLGNIRRCIIYKALEKWLSLTNEQESSLDGTQKNWTQPVFVKTYQEFISRMDDKCSKVFNAQQGKIGCQWLKVVPCKNLGLAAKASNFDTSNS